MKKLIKYLLVLVLCIPFIVFADGAAPSFAPYNAYVSDKDGASLYDYDYDKDVYVRTKHFLEYNHQIKIEDEEEVSKDLVYGYIEYNDEYYYINLNKISPLKEEYTVADLKKEYEIDPRETNEEYREEMLEVRNVLIMSDNVVLRKGPSIKYDEKEEKLQKDQVISKKAEVGSWIFVENETVSGWINKDNYIIMNSIDETVWLLEDTPVYDNVLISKAKELDIKLPKNEKFNNVYHYDYNIEIDEETDEYYDVYRLEYEGKAYYIDTDKAIYAENDSDKVITHKETDCYDEINGNVIKKVPQNTKAEEKYYAINAKENWIYVDFGEDSYWVRTTNIGRYFESPVKIVEDIDDVKNSITFPANTEFDKYYYASSEELYYVEYKGKNYWFNGENLTADSIDEDYGEYTTSGETYLYDKPNGEKTGVSIPNDTDVTITYEYYTYGEGESISWYYINSKNYKGWISDEENDMTEFQESLPKPEENTTTEDIRPITTTEPEVVVANKSLSKKEMIIICSLSAVILALLIYVIILLVNKKKKEKEQTTEPNTEVVENKQEDNNA